MADKIKDTGPLTWNVPIVTKDGRPTPEFQRRWETQRGNNAQIGTISFGSGSPSAVPAPEDGAQYIDVSGEPAILYVGVNGAWVAAGTRGANPTAIAMDTAVNGTAVTYMRSDAAPAIQKGSALQFGIVKVDGTTITSTGGVITSTAVASVGADPTATASDVAVNGVATTFMRSDAAPAIQKTSASVFGLAKVDGTSITASAGVISATNTFRLMGSVNLSPTASLELFDLVCIGDEKFPVGMTTSKFQCDGTATSNFTITLTLAGTPVATALILAGASTGSWTCASDILPATGQRLKLTCQATPDVTITGLSYTLIGSRI